MHKLKTREELKDYLRLQNDVFQELIFSKEPCFWRLPQFLEMHSKENTGKYGLADKLRETSICGIPSNVLFSIRDVCEELCDEISRIFVVSVNDQTARVCSAIDYEIAEHNYEDYCECPVDSHHTWAELEIDGVNYAFDFTRQYVMTVEAYYKFRDIKKEQIYAISDYKAILQSFTNFSYTRAMHKLYSLFCMDKKYLLESYDALIDNFSNNFHDVNDRASKKYCANELIRIKRRLEVAGLSDDYMFTARDVYLQWESFLRGINNEMTVIKNKNKQEQKDIINAIFPRSKEIYKIRNNTYAGPKEPPLFVLERMREVMEK